MNFEQQMQRIRDEALAQGVANIKKLGIEPTCQNCMKNRDCTTYPGEETCVFECSWSVLEKASR